MIVKGNDVIGLKVLTLKQGQQIEDVDDIIYDPLENRVKALLVDKGGWFSDAKVIPIESVKHIGKDAVMVDSGNVIKKASEVGKRVSHIAHDETYLTKTKVITENGTELGHITDLYFDDRTGNVKDFEVSQGLRDLQSGRKTIKVTDIITVGSDATIVRSAAEDKMQEQAQHQGVQGGMTKVKEGSSNAFDKTKQSLQSFGQQASEKSEELKNKTSQQMESMQKDESFQNRIQNAATTTRARIDEAQEAISKRVQESRKQYSTHQRENALGKYLTKNILTENDKVLAVRGDLITHGLLDEAEKAGVLDQMLSNVSNEPVEVTESVPLDIGELPPKEHVEDYRMYATLGGQKGESEKETKHTNTKKKHKKGGEKK